MRERTCAVVFSVERNKERDMTRGCRNVFFDTQRNDCACENVACGRCICLHLPSIAKEFKFPAKRKEHLCTRKIHYCSIQDEDRQEFQLLLQSSSCSHVDVGCRKFPRDLEGASSTLFEVSIFFKSFELLISSLSCSLCKMNWCISVGNVVLKCAGM